MKTSEETSEMVKYIIFGIVMIALVVSYFLIG